jgi:hypothetical protein
VVNDAVMVAGNGGGSENGDSRVTIVMGVVWS